MIKQPAFFTTAIHKTEGDHLNLKLAELFGRGKTVFSFEVFPPKRNDSIETIYKTLDRLRFLDPDFISVTYGASGSLADNSTWRKQFRKQLKKPPLFPSKMKKQRKIWDTI